MVLLLKPLLVLVMIWCCLSWMMTSDKDNDEEEEEDSVGDTDNDNNDNYDVRMIIRR